MTQLAGMKDSYKDLAEPEQFCVTVSLYNNKMIIPPAFMPMGI